MKARSGQASQGEVDVASSQHLPKIIRDWKFLSIHCWRQPQSRSILRVRESLSLLLDPIASEQRPPDLISYFETVRNRTRGKSLALSKAGNLILASLDTHQRDSIFIIFGCSVPVILREEEDGSCNWITDAYIYMVMDGEALDGLEDGRNVEEEIVLR
jgi:hypothetical protein